MARVKALTDEPRSIPPDTNVDMTVTILDFLSLEQLDYDSDQHRHIRFLIEQIQLTMKSKCTRVYSLQLYTHQSSCPIDCMLRVQLATRSSNE